MSDCANVEIRERLPDLLNGLLDARARSHVDAHVASCEECAAELETLRAVRQAYARAPEVDVRRIVAALPRPTMASRGRVSRRLATWRLAAALATVSVGGVSLAVANRYFGVGATGPDVTPPVDSPLVETPRPVAGRTDSGPAPAVPNVAPATATAITFGGGVSDLAIEDLEALERALDGLDASISVDPDPDVPIGPFGREGT